jgi:hypothetical protein
MKPLAPYFGNRFASVTKKKAIKSAAKTKATSEMETLESRILLSGVGTGLNKKNVSFFDADGDKVTVSLQGKGSFNIDLGGNTNNSDIANISINGVLNKTTLAVEAGSLGVVVTPAGSFTKPVQTKVIYNPNGVEGLVTTVGDVGNGGVSQKIATQFYDLTPGFTNIGSITTATNVTSVGSIGLNAAIVPVIDLGSAAAGNINLSTGMVAKVDQLMATNVSFQPDRPAWVANIGKIDLFDISAGSIAGINISSVGTDNDFNGDVVATTGGIGRITGTNADFNGTISLLGANSALGNIVVNSFSDAAVISAAGDLTFNAASYDGLLSVGGHLNLGLVGSGNFNGTIIAVNGVSGLGASLTDTILANQVSILGQIITQGDIASITLNNANISGGTLDAKNIGTIHFGANASLISGTILASEDLGGLVTRNAGLDLNNATIVVGDTVGLIDVAGGDLSGSITAANFTKITVRGGLMDADILGTSSIGDVTVTDGSITGSLIAQGAAGIGNIKAVSFDNAAADGGAIIGATIYSAGGIASITATTTDTTSPAIGETLGGDLTNIHALGTVGAITATSFGGAGSAAIQGLTFVAPTISGVTANAPFGVAMAGTNTFISTTGSIGNITATGLTGGINGATTLSSATTVGSISGTALSGTGAGISGLVINAQTGISTVTGKAFGGDGIGAGSEFYSLTGNISAISGSSTSMAGTGDGIQDLVVNAIAGSIADITGSSSGITGGHGLNNLDVDALTGIGTITGTAIGGNGIEDGTYDVTGDNANITAVVATTSTGTAINDADFSAVGGTISTITATPSGAGGNAIDGSTFEAEFLGNVSVTVSNLDGGFAINDSSFTAIAGAIGDITVVNKSLGTNFAAFGIGGNSNFTASNGIGAISVTVAANSTGGTVAAIQDIGAGAGQRPDFNADSDGDGTGNITSVSVISTGSGIAGISGATFTAEDITGNFSVAMNGLNAGDAINDGSNGGLLTVLDLAGNLGGNISVVNSSLNGASDGLDTVKLNIAGNVVGTTIITAAGGAAMNASAIDPVDMGAITLSGDAGAMIANSSILVTGEIAGLTVTGNITAGSSITAESFATTNTLLITGDLGGTITSETSIGAITVTGDMSGTIETDSTLNSTSTGGSIGTVTIGGEFSGSISASADTAANADIGAISIALGATAGTITTVGNVGTLTSYTVLAGGSAAAVTVGNISGVVSITGGLTAKIDANHTTAASATIGAITIVGGISGVGEIEAGGAVTSITVTGDIAGAAPSIDVGSITGALTVNGDIDSAVTTTVGGIGSIDINADPTTGATSLGEVNANITSFTTIGAIDIADDLTAGDTIQAGGAITSLTVGGDLRGNLTTTAGSIGAITVEGDISSTITSAANIGAIIGKGTGTVNNVLSLDTGAAGTIGDLTFNSGNLAAGETVEVTITDAVSVGAIQLASTAGNANLDLNGGAALTTVGAITVDGSLDIAGATLTSVKTLTSVNIGSFVANAGARQDIGSAAVAGSTVGSIAIGADVAFNVGPVAAYAFVFDTFSAATDAVVNGSNIVALDNAPTSTTIGDGSSLAGGIYFILA